MNYLLNRIADILASFQTFTNVSSHPNTLYKLYNCPHQWRGRRWRVQRRLRTSSAGRSWCEAIRKSWGKGPGPAEETRQAYESASERGRNLSEPSGRNYALIYVWCIWRSLALLKVLSWLLQETNLHSLLFSLLYYSYSIKCIDIVCK